MASTGNVFPTVGASVDRAGSTAWTSPGNVTADDGSNASAVIPTDYLVCSGFGFAIPANAVIDGIIVRVEASESGTGSSNYVPRLISNTTPTLIGAAKSAVTVNGTTPVISSNGSATDRWGVDLTPSIVNNSGFGVALWSTDTTNTLSIDFVTIEVHYTVPAPRSILPRKLGPFLRPQRGTGSKRLAVAGQFEQSVSGVISSGGALTKRTDRSLAAAVTSAGALSAIKTALLALTGTLTSAGTLARQTGKVLTAAIASAGVLGTVLFAVVAAVSRLPSRLGPFLPPRRSTGSTVSPANVFQQSVGGTLTSSGALTRRIDKLLGGAVAWAGAMLKSTSRALAGTLTSSGALTSVRVVLLALTGTLTSAGMLLKRAGKSLSGTSSSAGALTKQTQRALTATVTSAGALLRQTGKLLTGAIASAGAVIGQLAGQVVIRSRMPSRLGPFFVLFKKTHGSTKAPAAVVYQQSVGGTLGSSGSLVRRTGKVLVGTLTSAAVLAGVKVVIRAFTGAIASAGALVKRTSKSPAGSVASVGALIKRTNRALTGAIANSGTLTSLRVFVRAFTGALSSSGALARGTNKVVAGAMSSSGALLRGTAKTLAGVISSSGVLTKLGGAVVGFLRATTRVVAALVGRSQARGAAGAEPSLKASVSGKPTIKPEDE